MSNKKNRNKKPNKNIQDFPFANEVKQLKENLNVQLMKCQMRILLI